VYQAVESGARLLWLPCVLCLWVCLCVLCLWVCLCVLCLWVCLPCAQGTCNWFMGARSVWSGLSPARALSLPLSVLRPLYHFECVYELCPYISVCVCIAKRGEGGDRSLPSVPAPSCPVRIGSTKVGDRSPSSKSMSAKL